MTAPAVREVHSRADRKRFLDLPYRVHSADPMWVPPLRRDVAKLLAPKHPFYDHGELQLFLAERDGRVVARVAAIENRAHNEFHGEQIGFFGFFESEDDPDAARAILDAASEWVRARGLTHVRGPCSPSTNEECGILIKGFETPATLLTPSGPRYYPALVEGAGFAKAKDLLLHQRDATELPERLLRSNQAIMRRNGISLRRIDVKRFDEEIAEIKRIYSSAWERNWGFVPMSERELDLMAKELRPILVQDLIVFAEREGEVVGFAAALPDLNVALRPNRKGRFWSALPGILLRARKIERCRVLLLGLIPELRGKGIDSLLYAWVWEKARANKIWWGEAGWVLEDNAAMNNALERIGFDQYRTLRVYEKAL